MSREIKFRAWDKRNKRMLQIDKMALDNTVSGGNIIREKEHIYVRNEELEFLQYTGLKDKNDKEIYEGDIVKTEDNKIQLIIWNEDENGYRLKYKFKRKSFGEEYWETREDIRLSKTDDKRWGCEVIGNIYDNPELLEGEKND